MSDSLVSWRSARRRRHQHIEKSSGHRAAGTSRRSPHGNGEHFDSVLLGFVHGLLHAATRLLVAGDRMTIGHHHDVTETVLDGTVGVRALADEVDARDVILQGLAVGPHVAQPADEFDFVAVVQSSRVPRQDAVASVATEVEKSNGQPAVNARQHGDDGRRWNGATHIYFMLL
ncbi:hypothetical protein EYF80_039653 [Liparis tanakae]|uniref:Uncharacterized protein n=1 Tax=Liparis tanakae TaxID=230148 RepID=A0A4Z2GBR9_9TELE|nr:hypothetical protein EYF80_039653 [Liparis tanakae]